MVLNVSVANREFKQAETEQQIDDLIAELMNTDHSSWETHMSFTDQLLDPEDVDDDWYPDHDVTLSVRPGDGYAALRWMDVGKPDGRLCVTLNPTSVPDIDPLLIDGGEPGFFPRSAALPVNNIRQALLEFSRTGKRPNCVPWQDFDRI